MNRPVFNAMAAQYRVTRAEGTDRIRWEEGVRCRLPALTLRGSARQEGLDSRNLFWRQGGAAYDGLTVDYDADTQTFTLNGTVTGSPLIRLCTGMTLAIEPMVNQGGPGVKELPDGWTVKTRDGKNAAHYENTILITDGEPEILTAPAI